MLGLEGWMYDLWEVNPEHLPAILAEVAAPSTTEPAWAGLSVTMPHKQTVLPMLDAVDPLATVAGAVNTVVAQRAGTGRALLTGFNTDVAGIVGALREAAPADADDGTAAGGGARALVLGSGATACSALAALAEIGATDLVVAARRHAGPGRAAAAAHRMGLDVTLLTWNPGDAKSDQTVAEACARADIVVSTLPAGVADMLVEPLAAALDPRGAARAIMLDVVYASWPTPLAATWMATGRHAVPGWLMLLHQAVPQVALMTGRTPPIAPMREALENAVADR